MKRRVFGLAIAAWLAAPIARAQPSRFAAPPPPPPPSASERTSSFEGHLALAVAERLLASDDSDDRLRGVERLVSSGQREAIDRLLRALADGGSALRDPRARLAAIRGLFPYAAREPVRQAMEKALASEGGPGPLAPLARDTAALALAASDDPRSLAVLRSALRQGGEAGEAAERALLAYPPASLAPLGVGASELPAPVCDLLGKLGDQRAVTALRGTLARGVLRSTSDDTSEAGLEEQNREMKIAAALALARLGDQEQVPIARAWLASEDTALKLKGAEILLLSGAAGARSSLVPLLGAPGRVRAAAFRLAARAPGPEFLAAAAAAAKTPDDEGKMGLSLLGRLGGPFAVASLASLLRDPARAWDAAFALSRAPGREARRALEDALGTPTLVRLAARAGVVRALALRDEPSRLADALSSLFASNDPADRAAGAFGLAALGKKNLAELALSRDQAIVRAAARASLVLGPDAARALVPRLAIEKDIATRTALAMALASTGAGFDELSTHQLETWADGDDPIAPLAIVALGGREQPGDERRIGRRLESADPVLRVHAALALAASPLPTATGRLADAWRFEPDRGVRRAIVVALSQRPDPARLAPLGLAARLDPDADVREAAMLGLAGRLPSPLGRLGEGCARRGARVGVCYVAWISLVKSSAVPAAWSLARAASYVDASGLSLPVVSDPDGAVVLPGVSPGDGSFRLASSVFWYDALGHDGGQTGSSK
jgi:hypothetical protein